MKRLVLKDYQEFLRWIKAARASVGMTQTEVAERINQDASSISLYENGKRNLDVVLLFRLAAALGIRIGIVLVIPEEVNDED